MTGIRVREIKEMLVGTGIEGDVRVLAGGGSKSVNKIRWGGVALSIVR
jgi:hypothetical protein